MQKIWLASKSPRRAELLTGMNVPFEVLQFTDRHIARDIRKVLASAVANAVNNDDQDADELEQLRAIVNAQYSRDELVPGEQFGAGGASSVRGFQHRGQGGEEVQLVRRHRRPAAPRRQPAGWRRGGPRS